MSRCFPFPPPGYEKNIPTTHTDILKEKHREKKHKKEKQDKEKKEKAKDKKDRKENRRDKKEKVRDKDQQSDNPNTSAERRHKVQAQGHNVHNVLQKNSDTCILHDDPSVSRKNIGFNEGYHGRDLSFPEEPNGVKFVLSADRTVENDTERSGGQMMCEKIISIPHKRNERVGTFYYNNHLSNNLEDSNLALELDRRLKNEAEQPYDQSQTADNLIGVNCKRDGGVIKSASLNAVERGDKRIFGSNGHFIGNKSADTKMAPYASGLGQGNHDRMPIQSLDSSIEKKIEGQERVNLQEDNLQQRGKKRKDKESNGDRASHEKHKSREKERKEDKVNSRSDQKSADLSTRENCKMGIICAPNKEMLHSGEYNVSGLFNDKKLIQANGLLTNGISHVTLPSVFSQPLQKENGRAPEPYPMLVRPSPVEQSATGNIKIDKGGKINGKIETHVHRPATEQVIQQRPQSPHPDAKRFINILAIPRIEELPETDDSDWLVSSKDRPEKKHKVDDFPNCTSADMPQVWSKATTIVSADACALPYVIPF